MGQFGYHEIVPVAFEGILPALVTPFQEDGRIDFDAWQKIIDFLVDSGVHALFAGGSAGEFFSLDPEERMVSLRFCRQAVAGRVPLYANVGSITTRETLRLAEQVQTEGIADVLVVITPYYVRASQQELAAHYSAVCRAVRLPVMAYNFPPHGGVELSAEALGQIASRCDNLVGVKDSSDSLELKIAYRNCVPGRPLAVFTGPEALVLPSLEQGCAGAVTACANLAPRLFVDLYHAARNGRTAEARRLHDLAAKLGEMHGWCTFPGALKESMRMAGLPAGVCRRPIGPVPEDVRGRLATLVDALSSEGLLPKAANVHA